MKLKMKIKSTIFKILISYLQMQYYFDSSITEEEKLKLRNIIRHGKENIAIYFSSEIINFTEESLTSPQPHKSPVNNYYFNNPFVTFIISKDIFMISDHLESIIFFVANLKRCKSRSFNIVLNKKNDNNVNIMVYNAYSNLYLDSICYEFEIINNNVILVRNGTVQWEYIREPKTYKKFHNVISFNLIEQYNDFISSQKLLNINTESNDVNTNSKMNDLQTNEIEVVIKNKSITVKLKGEFNFDKLDTYLIKKFGCGKYEYIFDLNTEEETIKYVID